MAYTKKEQKRMANLVKAFSGYLRDNPNLDIAYAEKTGFVRLITAKRADHVYFRMGEQNQLHQKEK